VSSVEQISKAAARVRRTDTLPGLLDAGFDAFEVIRSVARVCEDLDPDLLPAFMMAASAAVEGRNALIDVPSLPSSCGGPPPAPVTCTGTDAAQAAGPLAALGALLAARFAAAARVATEVGDRAGCEAAGRSAAEVHRLLAAGDDETVTG
jgi:hypothetical protein